jgi:hypothetical protein
MEMPQWNVLYYYHIIKFFKIPLLHFNHNKNLSDHYSNHLPVIQDFQ